MADGLPNTNPMLGRLNKSAEETNELNKQIKEEGIDTNEAITEQLSLISSFTRIFLSGFNSIYRISPLWR